MNNNYDYFKTLLATMKQDTDRYFSQHPNCYSKTSKYNLVSVSKTFAKIVFDFMCIGNKFDDLKPYDDDELIYQLESRIRMLKDMQVEDYAERTEPIVESFKKSRSRKDLQDQMKELTSSICDEMGLIKPEALDVVNDLEEVSEMTDPDKMKSKLDSIKSHVQVLSLPGREENVNATLNYIEGIFSMIHLLSYENSEQSLRCTQSMARVSSNRTARNFKLCLA